MSRATDAYDVLTVAMIDTTPECLGLDLFTADDLDKDDRAVLAAICVICPLIELCQTYAEIERPKAGFWAGKTYRTNKAREAKS